MIAETYDKLSERKVELYNRLRLLIRARVMEEFGVELPDPAKPKDMDTSGLTMHDTISEEIQVEVLKSVLGERRGPYPKGLGEDKKRLKPSRRPKGSTSDSSSSQVYTAEEVKEHIREAVSEAVATVQQVQQEMAEMKALILTLTRSQTLPSADPETEV